MFQFRTAAGHKNPPSAPPAIPPIIITPYNREVPRPPIDPVGHPPGPPIVPPPGPNLRMAGAPLFSPG